MVDGLIDLPSVVIFFTFLFHYYWDLRVFNLDTLTVPSRCLCCDNKVQLGVSGFGKLYNHFNKKYDNLFRALGYVSLESLFSNAASLFFYCSRENSTGLQIWQEFWTSPWQREKRLQVCATLLWCIYFNLVFLMTPLLMSSSKPSACRSIIH